MTSARGAPLVSIVIPTKNGMSTLPTLFDRLGGGLTRATFEVIVVDSGSTDGTLELASARADRVLSVAPEAFDHGLTRNRGVEAALAPLVVLLVQDALPSTEDWLDRLIDPLQRDARLAGVWARQEPRPDAPAIVRHYMERGSLGSAQPRTSRLRDEPELRSLAPLDRLARCTFDNVCSCIRRSVWQSHPFRSLPIAEDLAWARDVLLAGYELAFVPEVTVIHSHDRPARYEYARTRLLHRQLADLFDVVTVPTPGALTRAIATSAALHLAIRRRHGGDLTRALALAVAWPLGQYAGARDARLKRRPVRTPGV